MINKAATSGRNVNGIPTVYEMLASTTRLLRNFMLNDILQPPKVDRKLVRRIVDDWEAGVKVALPLVGRIISDEIARYLRDEEEEQEEQERREEEEQERREEEEQERRDEILWTEERLRIGHSFSSTNLGKSFSSKSSGPAARLAEEKRNQKESERAFAKAYGPIDSPRRVADLLNALDDNPSDLIEFTELVKTSYKLSTAIPWSRLDGRNMMVHYVWSFREASPNSHPTEVISAALSDAGKTTKEVETILSEASKFRSVA
jgi:hypothetical protein